MSWHNNKLYDFSSKLQWDIFGDIVLILNIYTSKILDMYIFHNTFETIPINGGFSMSYMHK